MPDNPFFSYLNFMEFWFTFHQAKISNIVYTALNLDENQALYKAQAFGEGPSVHYFFA